MNVQNQKVETIELSDNAFGVEVKEHLFWQVVRMQMANRRGGNSCTKDRGEVAYSTAKMFRQKGTGRARMGSRRSGLRVGGGVIFGPKPRDYSYKVPKKVRAAALASALSMKTAESDLVLLDELKMEQIKTKEFAEMLSTIGAEHALVVIGEKDETLEKSSRNIPNVKVLRVEGLNVYDILRYKKLVVTKGALPKIEQRFSK
jgi:large subunit ribosomal protein L4